MKFLSVCSGIEAASCALDRLGFSAIGYAEIDKDGMSEKSEVPKVLDAIAKVVLAYRPKPKTKPAKKRQRRRVKFAKRPTNHE